MPGFGGLKCVHVNLIFAWRAVSAGFPRRFLKNTGGPVVEEKELITRQRDGVLSDRRQSIGPKCERELAQGGKLIPVLGWVAQNPFYRLRVISERNHKIFTARNNQRIIGSAISSSVIMEPVG